MTKVVMFEGEISLMGKQCTVMYDSSDNQAVLTISGLDYWDAEKAVLMLHRFATKHADPVADPAPPTGRAGREPRNVPAREPEPEPEAEPADEPASEPASDAAPVADGVPAHHQARAADEARRRREAFDRVVNNTQPAPAEPESTAEAASAPNVDVAAMNGMEKLRDVIEHVISRGFKTAAEVLDVLRPLTAQVSVLQKLEAKAGAGAAYDKRLERAILTVLE